MLNFSCQSQKSLTKHNDKIITKLVILATVSLKLCKWIFSNYTKINNLSKTHSSLLSIDGNRMNKLSSLTLLCSISTNLNKSVLSATVINFLNVCIRENNHIFCIQR